MDYDNLIEDNGIYLYKDDSLNTIFISLIFKRDKGNKNDAVYNILQEYLLETNSIYKNASNIREIKNDCYSMDIEIYNCYYGETSLMYVSIDLVSAQVLGDDYLDKAFLCIRNLLLKPDFTNEERLEKIKRKYLAKSKQSLSDSSICAERKYKEEIYEGGRKTFKFSTNYKHIERMINSVNLDDLEKAYKKSIIEGGFFKGFVYGNITDEEFERFRYYVPFVNKEDEKIECISVPTFNKDVIEIPNKYSKESIVYITYSLDGIDKALYNVLFDIINVSGDLCLNILRNKYNLVYSSSATIGYSRGTIIFKTEIDKKNIDKLISAVDEIVTCLKDKEKIKEFLVQTRENIKNDNYILSECRSLMIDNINDYVTGIFNRFNENEFANNIDNLKEEDIVNKTKTLKRRNIFIYRGDDCE